MATKKQTEMGPFQEAARAFRQVRDRMQALEPESIVPITIDIGRAVGIVIAAEPRIAQLMPAIERLPDFPVKEVRDLRELALAAWYAHFTARPNGEPDPVGALVEEALSLGRMLRQQAEALAGRSLLNGDSIPPLRGGRSHRQLATDLVALAHLFQNAWEDLEGRTSLKRAEIDSAANLGTQLMLALGARDVPQHGTEEVAGDARARTFTLLARSYDEARRAIGFLRWHEGDANAIAPSMYSARGRKRPAVEQDPAPAPVVTTPPIAPPPERQ